MPLLLWSYLAGAGPKVRGQPIARWKSRRWSPTGAARVLTLRFMVRMLPMEPFATLRV